MTIITGHSRKGRRLSRRDGFTLVETMVAMSLGLLVGGTIFSALIFMGKSTLGIANYSDMNTESRLGLERFGRDVRSASDVLDGFNATSFTLRIPRPDGSGDDLVTYEHRPDDPGAPLVRVEGTDEQVLMNNVEELEFRYFNLQGGAAAVRIEVKQIQLSLRMVRRAITIDNTEQVVSARYILRNKRVSQ